MASLLPPILLLLFGVRLHNLDLVHQPRAGARAMDGEVHDGVLRPPGPLPRPLSLPAATLSLAGRLLSDLPSSHQPRRKPYRLVGGSSQ